MQSTAASKCIFSSFRLLVSGFLAVAASANLHATPASAAPRLASISVPFVANQGQIDSRVSFYARTFAGTVFVTTDGRLVYSLAGGRNPARVAKPAGSAALTGWTLSESFTGAPATPVGLRPAITRISNFVGPAATPHSDAPTYERVGIGQVAPGVSLELRASGNNVEKLFQVAPGADAKRIRVRIEGASSLSLAEDGSLVIGTGLGEFQLTAPVAYQERDGSRILIPAKYILAATGEYGFAVGPHDQTLPLTIDPLIRSTYSGGTAPDGISAILVHPGSGHVYVTGWTTSTDFPGTATGAQENNLGGTHAFVAHYNEGLTTLVRASYFGGSVAGSGVDIANAIAILPSSGDIYIAGTTSSATGLPNISGSLSGATDVFIARFNGALSTVIGARYYGGTGGDTVSGLAVDNIAGEIIVAGDTTSTDLALGTGPPPPQSFSGGGQDGFVARFSANLSLVRASYFGGGGADRALAVAVDPITRDVVLAGVTQSTNLPGAANGALPTNGGSSDGFVARFDGGLTTLRQSTYFGGIGADQINAVAVHPLDGRIYVTGDTASTDLRGKPAGQIAPGGGSDAFVARFHQDLTGLQAVSYFGGTGDEFGKALAVSKFTGEIYITGYSTSPSLPGTVLGVQPNNAGDNDAFVARFDAGLTGVKQATFLGGTDSDKAYAIALTDTVAYIAGETASATFQGTTGSAQPTIGGGSGGISDGFVSAMGSDLRQANSNPATFAFAAIASALPLSVQTSAPALITPTGNALAYVDGQPGSTWCGSSTAGCGCDRTGGVFISGSAPLVGGPPYYVCVRHTASAAPNAITESTMHIGAMAATFRVGTGAIPGFGCTLDVDGNGAQDALTDGLLVLRALFGLTGTAVTNGVVGASALRTDWSNIRLYLNTNCGASVAP